MRRVAYVTDMRIAREHPDGSHVIQSYDADGIVVNERRYTAPLLLSAREVVTDWDPHPPESLAVEHLRAALAMAPDVILLATGERIRFPSAQLRGELAERRIGLEVMDDAAACRTFNVIAAEGRPVVLVLPGL